MSSDRLSFAVLGAGSWGTALAKLLAENGHPTWLWGKDAEQLRQIAQTRENTRFLPGVVLPANLTVSDDLSTALSAAQIPLIAIPSHGFRQLVRTAAQWLAPKGCLVWASKGLEDGSHALLHHVAEQELGEQPRLAVISGPNFAREVAQGMVTATTVAANDAAFAAQIAQHLNNAWFRAYTSNDMLGVQLGGALKNALAIAAGIAVGLGFGANSRAALLTRGLAEMVRLATSMGAHSETLMGLAGLGDLVLTCTDNQSRNRRLGILLAEGKDLATAQAEIGQVVEGVRTAEMAYLLAQRHQVSMPIVEQVYRVLYQGISPADAVEALLLREPTSEI